MSEVLTGRTKGKERREIEERIASGEAQIVIGTHALFQDSVSYKNLVLAVVDEQHRFGVHQRLRLTAKGLSFDTISELMGISPHTVVAHVRKIYRKLAVHSRGEAVYEATQLGLL